jgi:hypothetical protein
MEDGKTLGFCRLPFAIQDALFSILLNPKA